VAKVLYDSTSQKILVVCFTNHALDQFLEDLMDIGIPSSAMVRLGGKSTDRTKSLMLREQAGVRLDQTQRAQIDKLKQKLQMHEARLQDAFRRFQATNVQKNHRVNELSLISDPSVDDQLIPKTRILTCGYLACIHPRLLVKYDVMYF